MQRVREYGIPQSFSDLSSRNKMLVLQRSMLQLEFATGRVVCYAPELHDLDSTCDCKE